MDAIYEVHGLTKRYGRTAALNGVDFAVTPGKLVGLLGPNGSGKTTLMKISAGLLQPTAGSVIIDKVPGRRFHQGRHQLSAGPYGPANGVHRRRCRKPVRGFFTDFDKVKANAMLADLHIGRQGQNRFHEQRHTGKDAALPDDEPCRQALPAG